MQEDAEILGQRVKLKADLVLRHALAGQARPVDRLLAFLDVLLGCAKLIVEMDDSVRVHGQVGDYETDAGEQIAGMPLYLGDAPVLRPPTFSFSRILIHARPGQNQVSRHGPSARRQPQRRRAHRRQMGRGSGRDAGRLQTRLDQTR